MKLRLLSIALFILVGVGIVGSPLVGQNFPLDYPIELNISVDSLIIIIPGNRTVPSLYGLEFEYFIDQQAKRSYFRDYRGFEPYNLEGGQILRPKCFRLYRSDSADLTPWPFACSQRNNRLELSINPADAFWIDGETNERRIFYIFSGANELGQCNSAQLSCLVEFTPYEVPTVDPTLTNTGVLSSATKLPPIIQPPPQITLRNGTIIDLIPVKSAEFTSFLNVAAPYGQYLVQNVNNEPPFWWTDEDISFLTNDIRPHLPKVTEVRPLDAVGFCRFRSGGLNGRLPNYAEWDEARTTSGMAFDLHGELNLENLEVEVVEILQGSTPTYYSLVVMDEDIPDILLDNGVGTLTPSSGLARDVLAIFRCVA